MMRSTTQKELMMNPLNRPHKIEVIKDANGEFRWRRKSGNSRIISTSGEGYTTKVNMWNGLRLANADWEGVEIDDQTTLDHEQGQSPSS